MNRSNVNAIISIALLAACALLLRADLPQGWSLGADPGAYESEIDTAASYHDQPSTSLKSTANANAQGFGTVQRSINDDLPQYRGKRIRFSANVKAQGVEGWAGLWMRIDGARNPANGRPAFLGFDNMQGRPIAGTKDWQSYSIVLDVPEAAVGIYQGLLLHGSGHVWLNGVKVDVVGNDVPTTGGSSMRKMPSGPTNLSFDK